ncbi:MAG: hypothetical protein WKG01_18105 [Kofleriaceae bacterium]
MTSPRRELDQVIAAIADRKPAIDLGPVDICFLIALHVRAEGASLTSFTEHQLEDAFAHASATLQPEVENVRRRATHAIHRLRDQRMLARVDGQGVVRTGEFALSRLATGIVEFFLQEDVLTRASLHVLVASLRTAISDILATARTATEPAHWADGVVGPLQVTIAELVAGIERRQRGLDLQQENFQTEIRRLLEADWFGALDQCQMLLESTSATLHELNEMLLRDSSELLALLHDIEELAVTAGETDAEGVAHRLMDQIDRSVSWGTTRQRAWSEYFQYVHRYLRDVVRLDQHARSHSGCVTSSPAAARVFARLCQRAPAADPPHRRAAARQRAGGSAASLARSRARDRGHRRSAGRARREGQAGTRRRGADAVLGDIAGDSGAAHGRPLHRGGPGRAHRRAARACECRGRAAVGRGR